MTANRLFVLHLNKIQRAFDFSEPGQPATFIGEVYRTKCGFPVLAQGGSSLIQGSLYSHQSLEIQQSLMDEVMGFNPQNPAQSLFHREQIRVQTQSGESVSTWCYLLNPCKLTSEFTLIENGEWQYSLSAYPPLTEKLSEKQKSYIKKLGSSSGRDVIPINLALYRELMNLELIVDKGRRLALSKFGQEVFSYLE